LNALVVPLALMNAPRKLALCTISEWGTIQTRKTGLGIPLISPKQGRTRTFKFIRQDFLKKG
jgi:hypothetical protein